MESGVSTHAVLAVHSDPVLYVSTLVNTKSPPFVFSYVSLSQESLLISLMSQNQPPAGSYHLAFSAHLPLVLIATVSQGLMGCAGSRYLLF